MHETFPSKTEFISVQDIELSDFRKFVGGISHLDNSIGDYVLADLVEKTDNK